MQFHAKTIIFSLDEIDGELIVDLSKEANLFSNLFSKEHNSRFILFFQLFYWT